MLKCAINQVIFTVLRVFYASLIVVFGCFYCDWMNDKNFRLLFITFFRAMFFLLCSK